MAIEIEENVSLKSLTSWLVGGTADFLARPRSIDDLRDAQAWAVSRSLPVSILGGGSNVLVSDRGVRGLTISLRKFSSAVVSVEGGRLSIECLAGTSKSELLKLFLKHKLEPALFLAGLPG